MSSEVLLHERVTNVLRERIGRGHWPAGMRLPSEAALCREFGTSRGPVRRALAVLREEGYVVGGRGRAPMVGRVVPTQPFSTFSSFTVWARAIGKTPGQRTIEAASRNAPSTVAGFLGLDEGASVVQVVRVRMLDDVPTMVERTSFAPAIGVLLEDMDPDRGSLHEHLIGKGVDLRRARHTIDAVAANPLDAEALGVGHGSPLLRERRITFDSARRPLSYADDRYRPELATFTIENEVDRRTPLTRSDPTADASRRR
ncbi:GntR family transcriptional regulator [Agromyces flavus]|uniref:GntR family transcriptional regulator n=1 Tax=Agromyces flavus TaxID=589382 RepID=A0A1H1ZRQ3_9MICO|nr:GntR family transcriptional regulator [Agromyces flavus]MCP2367211.1 GntR family transcriptional regulator [Agromyces flavus]GGI46181.1 GntR family transcriptional regulator [Agromyces flavus]SDT35936.1 GntR family transcriptional regulator [Agromyces flavus]